MRKLRAGLSRLAGIFNQSKRDRELADELDGLANEGVSP
jgi:hypothetical protein